MRGNERIALRRKYGVFLVIFLLVFWVFSKKTLWDGQRRVTLVVPMNDSSVSLVVFDPSDFLITVISIPSNTRITVPYGMGEWPLRSVWELGEQEGYGGEFLMNGVMKTFRLPVDFWVSREGEGFATGKVRSVLRAVLVPYGTNMTYKEKILLGIFSLRVSDSSRVMIDLREMGGVEKVSVGGEEAYLVRESVPGKLVRLFSLRNVLNEGALVGLVDASDGGVERGVLADLIEHVGAKVVSVDSVELQEDLDCIVRFRKKITSMELARLFSCELRDGEPEGNVDVELQFGGKFKARW